METLPLEIQNEIWKIYYKDLYSNNIQQMNCFFCKINNFDNNIEEIKKILRIIRFSVDENTIFTTKKNLKKKLEYHNNQIIDILNNKTQKIISKRNDIFCYLIQLTKFKDYYTDIDYNYKLIVAYFNKYCNFQDNILDRLKRAIQ